MSKRILAASAIAFALTGCASIFNGQTQAVTIKSVPDGAAVSVTNRAGEKIHTGVAPVTLTLKRGAGYFKAESYLVKMTKEGYEPKELVITGNVSGWYVGNVLFGGLIGMLAVDPVTGAMYTFPESVSATLDSNAPKTSQAELGALRIVSTDTLSPALMAQARRLPSTAGAQ